MIPNGSSHPESSTSAPATSWGQGSAPDGGKRKRGPSGKRLVALIIGYACVFGLALSLTIRQVLHNMKRDHEAQTEKSESPAEKTERHESGSR